MEMTTLDHYTIYLHLLLFL